MSIHETPEIERGCIRPKQISLFSCLNFLIDGNSKIKFADLYKREGLLILDQIFVEFFETKNK